MDTIAKIVVTPPSGTGDAHQGREMQLTAHLFVKMPDRVKFQILSSSFPLFNRWIFVQRGNDFAAYDPVSDRYVTTDFRRLTGREPARVDTKLALLGLLYDPARYRFRMEGKMVLNGNSVYRVRMTLLKPEVLNPLIVLAYTDLYVDVARMAPVHSESYDTVGQLVTTGDFRDLVRTAGGWAPTRVTITEHQMERLRSHPRLDRALEGKALGKTSPRASTEATDGRPVAAAPKGNGRVDIWMSWRNGMLFPRKMIARPPGGAATQWVFSNTRVNVGLTDSSFRLQG